MAGRAAAEAPAVGRYGYLLAAAGSNDEASAANLDRRSLCGRERSASAAARAGVALAAVAVVVLASSASRPRPTPWAQDEALAAHSTQLHSVVSMAADSPQEAGLVKRARAGAAEGAAVPLTDSTLRKPAALRSQDLYIGFGPTPPEYPLPYRHGEHPTTYNYSGGFPKGFVWGTGTSAYQIEGAYREDGRGASIWDTFTGADTAGMPGEACSYCCKVAPCTPNEHMGNKGATGSVANDHYHTWKADVALMKAMGLKHYRFSISWSRVIPTGKLKDGINQKGIDFYNTLIDSLLKEGITPYVTIYHWDLPQGLLDPPRVQGWYSVDEDGRPNGQIQQDFLDYCDLCFKTFGDRVRFWITFNEPWTFLLLASGWGSAPSVEPYLNMTIAPYIGGHNVLNAHAAAVDLYRRKYQDEQKGIIGITNNCDWKEPMSEDPQDVAAAERNRLFSMGWFTDPIFGDGDYPAPMRTVYGERLPNFTAEQRQLLRGSADFFGLNHYATTWTSNSDDHGWEWSYSTSNAEGFPTGQSTWLHASGWGFRKLLAWIGRRYGNPPLYVTENGWSLEAHTAEDGMHDPSRVMYFANYTAEMRKAIDEDGVDVRGYFAWSLLDNFEWSAGYNERFGITYNDYVFGMDPHAPTNTSTHPTEGEQVRTRKDSSCWLEKLWRSNELLSPEPPSFQGCPGAQAFHGHYADSSGCTQRVVVHASESTGEVSAVGGQGACKRAAAKEKLASVKFSGSTIIANLSSRGGPEFVLGFWNSVEEAIEWGDGSRWEKLQGDALAHVH